MAAGAHRVAHTIAITRAKEMYDAGIHHLTAGRLQEAILDFQEASFFAPQNANPLVALAECYVFLCDLQSAVRLYRRALWVLSRRARLEARATAHAHGHLLLYSHGASSPIFPPAPSLPSAGNEPAAESEVGSSGTAVAADDIRVPASTSGTDERLGADVFNDDTGVGIEATRRRLAGLLDALGLVLFRMSDFEQALRYANDALEQSPGARDAVIELHKCVCLMALGREEEAEFQLEAHKEQHPERVVQSAALLIQLYCNRQAFRPARMLLDELVGLVRHERSLTIAKHVYLEKYRRYRRNALEKVDLGTISKCIEVNPSDVELLFARARILIDAGKAKRSVKDLFRCIKETNGTHKEAVETMTSVLFSIGSSLDGESGLLEAVSYYSESLKWRSDNSLVLLARGDCYVRLEDYENALTDYRRVLNINPDDATASSRIAFLHDVWGRKLHSLGKVKEAEAEFTNAIKTVDTEPLFYYHRALCRFQLNEPRYGLRDVLSCQQLQPADPRIRAFVHRYLGTAEEPLTTRAGKERLERQQGLLVVDSATGATKLSRERAPRQFHTSAMRAQALYGRPSARIAKVLLEVQDDAEATGQLHKAGGARPREELVRGITGAVGPAHLTYKSFVASSNPAGDGLSMVRGARTRIHEREAASAGIHLGPRAASSAPKL